MYSVSQKNSWVYSETIFRYDSEIHKDWFNSCTKKQDPLKERSWTLHFLIIKMNLLYLCLSTVEHLFEFIIRKFNVRLRFLSEFTVTAVESVYVGSMSYLNVVSLYLWILLSQLWGMHYHLFLIVLKVLKKCLIRLRMRIDSI